MRLLILSAAVSAALVLSACSMAPKLVKPEMPVPTAYTTAVAADQHANAADLGWRSMFGDRRLQRLIELALENNRDLRLAALNVQAAEAQYGIQRSARLPSIGAGAS